MNGKVQRELEDGSEDALVQEEPLLIQVENQQLLTMRTPGRDEDLALGFLLSEAILENVAEVRDMHFVAGNAKKLQPDCISLNLTKPLTDNVRGRLTRTHEIRSSCGICGLTDVDELLEGLRPLLPGVPKLTRFQVFELRDRFLEQQPLFAATGASHAAAIFATDGKILGSGEDVGRHNALDKAIGQAMRASGDLSSTVALLSGRAGFDLVLKCLRMRIPMIGSISAASALSFDVCRAAGATLIGFLREDRMKVYCSNSRLLES